MGDKIMIIKLKLVLNALEMAENECRGKPDTEWTKLDYAIADSISDMKEIINELDV